MNTKSLAKLAVISLALGLSQLAGQAQTPQLKQNSTLNNYSQSSNSSASNRQRLSFIPSGIGAPTRTLGGGTR
jgi:hypothetical protein